jgi:hypothetical protein
MPTHPFLPTTRVGKYEVIAHVATGGMGAVYKAVDVSLGRLVALKVLATRLVENPSALERFRREARNAARLNHPNIVTLYEWGKTGESYFLAMEYVDGPDLDEYILSKGRLDVAEARAVLIQAVQALDHSYRQGIIHRDIKPSNFLLARQGGDLVVKLTDLGLSRTVADEDYRVTRDGSTVGTVDYLSPEQSRDGSLADIRSDIYSLGCTGYHMLAGQPPFSEGGLGERVYKHLHTEPTDVRRFNSEVPPGMWMVLKKMLAKAPGARYQTPAGLLHDLQHLPAAAPDAVDPAPASPPGARGTPAPPTDRRETLIEGADDDAASALSTPEKRAAAARQFERATEVLAVGDAAYARHLLLSCCELDPANQRYRQTLRQITQKPGRRLSGWTAPFSRLAAKARLKVAQRKGDHLKVLQHGEEVVAFSPKDLKAHLAMSAAAEALGLMRLALWLAEQAVAQDSHNPAPLRALARLCERQGRLSQALRLWALVRLEAPNDTEAAGKMNDLAAQETIERGNYKGLIKKPGRRGKPPTDC